MSAPEGYRLLPNGIRCRCMKLYQEAPGGPYWCCNPSVDRAATLTPENYRRMYEQEPAPDPSSPTYIAAGLVADWQREFAIKATHAAMGELIRRIASALTVGELLAKRRR